MHISRKLSIRLAFGIVFGYILLMVVIIRFRLTGGINQTVSSGMPTITDTSELETSSRVVLHNFERSETRDDKKLWEIRAITGELFPQINKARLSNFKMDMHQKDGTLIQMTAPKGILALEGTGFRSADVTNGVVIYYGDIYVIRTESASYLRTDGRITSPSRTTIEGENLNIAGDSLVVHVDSKLMELKGNVSTRITGKVQAPSLSAPKANAQILSKGSAQNKIGAKENARVGASESKSGKTGKKKKGERKKAAKNDARNKPQRENALQKKHSEQTENDKRPRARR